MVNQRVFVSWLPVAISVTLVLGTVYAAVQQNYRQSANDPQVELVVNGAMMLSGGLDAEMMSRGLPRIDVSKSLSTFLIFFDDKGSVVASTGMIGSSTPLVPPGVLQAAREKEFNQITWQIPSGERFATVVKFWQNPTTKKSGYILSARSLREIEEREFQLEMIVGLGWLLSMILSLVAVWFNLLYHRKYMLTQP